MRSTTQILDKPTLLPGGEKLTSSQGVSPASPLAQPENVKAPMMTATSGRKCFEQYAKSSPHGLLVKTFVDLLLGTTEWSSSRCVLTWKLKVMKFNRSLFLLQVSTLPTVEREYGLLPTPTAMEPGWRNLEIVDKKGQDFPKTINQRWFDKKSGRLVQKGLNNLAHLNLLPTPRANDAEKRGAVSADPRNGITGMAVNGLLPTPKTVMKGSPAEANRRSPGLAFLAKSGMLPTPQSPTLDLMRKRIQEGWKIDSRLFSRMLPTPTAASDPKGGCTRTDPSRQNDTLAHSMHGVFGEPGKTSQLNHRFVAEMMGFPPHWTELPFLSSGPNP